MDSFILRRKDYAKQESNHWTRLRAFITQHFAYHIIQCYVRHRVDKTVDPEEVCIVSRSQAQTLVDT